MMEIQEAIKRLEFLNEALNFQRADADESSCALQMAIKALEMISKRDELEDFNNLENYIAEWNKYKVFHSDDPTEELHWMHALIRYYMVQFKLYKDSELSPKEVLEMKTAYEQYRALGTVRQVQDFIADWRKFRELGNLEELRVARDKQVAKKLRENDECINCGNELWMLRDTGANYCQYCGQKLDWSDEDDKKL